MPGTLLSVARILKEPVLRESRQALADTWAGLPPEYQTSQQMFGKQGNCCGATIGAMPRCDFACRGCYLGEDANHVKAEGVAGIERQMDVLRPLLGPNGNLQLTDGEITLRPEEELVALLHAAERRQLVPMVMTHGDTFRRKPGLLERLMEQGGLREVSIHVDTTMRGRIGVYKQARTEADLNPLREEFAEMIRNARRTTGLPLVAATTMTVTRDNLTGVSDVVRTVSGLADAFKMISFQPVAQVGRTEQGLGGGVSADELWREVARGLDGPGADPDYLYRSRMWLGHPDCNRYVHGFVVRDGGRTPVFHSLRDETDTVDVATIEEYMRRFGGASFRRDKPFEARTRAAAMILRAPGFWAGKVAPYFWHQVKKWDPEHPLSLASRVLRGRARADHFNIVSHHFMGDEEVRTAKGKERLDVCVFRVPIGDRLVAMCEVNAMGVRDAYYAHIKDGHDPREMRDAQGAPFVPVGRPADAGRRALRVLPQARA